MTAVYIILGIAAALFLLSLLRVGVRIAFGDELRVTAMAGPVRVRNGIVQRALHNMPPLKDISIPMYAKGRNFEPCRTIEDVASYK